MAASAKSERQDGFRQYLHPYSEIPNQGLIRGGINFGDAYEYSRALMSGPVAERLFAPWDANLKEPYRGITSDGLVKKDLYTLQDEGAPTVAAAAEANRLLDALSPEQVKQVVLDLDGEDWRKWCNPEIIWHEIGLRLEHLNEFQVKLVWNVLKSSLSDAGYAKARAAVKINHFIGQLTNNPAILTDKSYFFCIFGRPSEREPWGYTFFGHHLALNVFFVGGQMTIGPTFIGCEPNVIDDGPDKGVVIFTKEMSLARSLMNSLTQEQRKKAQKSDDIDTQGPDFHVIEQRHVAGASHDNRLIPYEGLNAKSLHASQQVVVVDIVAAFQELLPASALAHRLELVKKHFDETYITWSGKCGENDAFYVRIHSPVILIELDCHTGVYLANKTPRPWHIHTIHRLPNAGDYSRALIEQWRKKNPA